MFSAYSSEYYLQPKAYLDIVSGKMISNKIIHIKDDKIISIEELKAQDPAKIIKLKEIYLLPGLIDCHTHVLFTQTKEDKTFDQALKRESKLDSEFRIKRALIILNQYLNAGFTSLCDLGNSGKYLDSQLKELSKFDYKYPTLYISGPGLAGGKGQFNENTSNELASTEYKIINNSKDIDIHLSELIKNNVDILKIYLDNSPGLGHLDKSLLVEVMKNTKLKKFKKITFHATTLDSLKTAFENKIINLEHVNQVGIDSKLLSNLKFVTPTDIDIETLKEFNYYHKHFFDYQIKRLGRLANSKAKLVFGPDLYFNRSNALFDRGQIAKRALNNYQLAGISNIEILRALTLNPALSLGEENVIGSIKVNSMANFVGFKKNPLVDINILQDKPMVINRGKIIK